MAEDEQDTPAGLKQQLEEYRASLEELNEGLTIDPANEELVKLKKDLLEVIVITETRLRILSQNATDPTPPAAAGAASPRPVETINVGDKVYSIYSADGLWYEAVVKQVQPGGTYSVTFTGYGNSEDRKQEHLRRIDGSVTLEQLNAVASAAQGNSKKRTTAAWESSTTDPKKQAKYDFIAFELGVTSLQASREAQKGGPNSTSLEAVCEQGTEDEDGHGHPKAEGVDL